MAPELVAAFISALRVKLNRQREQSEVARKLEGLSEAISEGLLRPSLRSVQSPVLGDYTQQPD